MKMVIDIPDRIYKVLQKHRVNIIDGKILEEAVKNGTPLPKGHGDLIDRNELLELTDVTECSYNKGISRYDVITMPAIIEADKESD